MGDSILSHFVFEWYLLLLYTHTVSLFVTLESIRGRNRRYRVDKIH